MYKQINDICQLKDVDVKKGILIGYLSNFGSIDSDGDIIHKGSYAKTIQENGPQGNGRIKMLLDHNRQQVIAKFNRLEEDNHGLRYESQLGTHTLAQEVLKMAESGLLTEHSVAISSIKEEMKSDGNHMYELKLKEGSILQFWGANENTPLLSIKGFSDASEQLELMHDLLMNYEKAYKTGTFTDETFKSVIIPNITKIKARIETIIDSVDEVKEPIGITLKLEYPTDEDLKSVFKKILNNN